MKSQNKSRQIYLISILLCVITPQVYADSSGGIKNKLATTTSLAIDETVANKPPGSSRVKPKGHDQSGSQQSKSQTLENAAKTPVTAVDYPGANLDIIGFRVGMSPDEVQDKLLNYRDDFKIEVYNSTPANKNKKVEIIRKGAVDIVQSIDDNNLPEHVYEIRAYVQGGNESFEFNFLKPPASNTLYGINRILIFSKDKAPEGKRILAKLKGKYGQRSSRETPNSIQWVYDDNGNLRLEVNGYLEQYCDGRLDENFPLLDATGGCGTWVTTNIGLISGTNFIKHLTVKVSEAKSHLFNEKESQIFIKQLKNHETHIKNRELPNL